MIGRTSGIALLKRIETIKGVVLLVNYPHVRFLRDIVDVG